MGEEIEYTRNLKKTQSMPQPIAMKKQKRNQDDPRRMKKSNRNDDGALENTVFSMKKKGQKKDVETKHLQTE